MRQMKAQKRMYRAAGWIELFVSIAVLIALLVFSAGLIREFYTVVIQNNGNPEFLSDFLGSAFQIVIGVEFIKMLCKHTPATVVEVLMFAIARQMVVEHSTPMENLVCIIGITVLFAIRRFLFTDGDKEDHYQENIAVVEETHIEEKEPCVCPECPEPEPCNCPETEEPKKEPCACIDTEE